MLVYLRDGSAQFYALPHWDRSGRSNFLPHPVTVNRHQADQSQCWPCIAWQGSHWSANFEVTGMTRPGKIPLQAGFEPQIFRSWGGRLNHYKAVVAVKYSLGSDCFFPLFHVYNTSVNWSMCALAFPPYASRKQSALLTCMKHMFNTSKWPQPTAVSRAMANSNQWLYQFSTWRAPPGSGQTTRTGNEAGSYPHSHAQSVVCTLQYLFSGNCHENKTLDTTHRHHILNSKH